MQLATELFATLERATKRIYPGKLEIDQLIKLTKTNSERVGRPLKYIYRLLLSTPEREVTDPKSPKHSIRITNRQEIK